VALSCRKKLSPIWNSRPLSVLYSDLQFWRGNWFGMVANRGLGLGCWVLGIMGLKRNGEGDRVLGVRFNMAGNRWVWVGLILAGDVKYGLSSVHCGAHVCDHPRINAPDVFDDGLFLFLFPIQKGKKERLE